MFGTSILGRTPGLSKFPPLSYANEPSFAFTNEYYPTKLNDPKFYTPGKRALRVGALPFMGIQERGLRASSAPADKFIPFRESDKTFGGGGGGGGAYSSKSIAKSMNVEWEPRVEVLEKRIDALVGK